MAVAGEGWGRELKDFTRAFSGAFIFGIPLLFTMEMWWIGEYLDWWKLVTFVAVAFGANVGLSWVAGFKRESSFLSAVTQAIEVVAVGLVAALVVLFILNRISIHDPLAVILGTVIIQAVPLSIGASAANEIFRARGGSGRQGDEDDVEVSAWKALLNDIGATAIGGVFIGMSIAPTEEIPMIAAGLGYPHLTAVMAFSLIVSFLVLWLFDQIEGGDPLRTMFERTIVLAVPTTVGGAAGRLVV